MPTQYNAVGSTSPYGSSDPYYTESTGFITPAQPMQKKSNNWLKFGAPVLILVIIGAVLGGVLGTRHSNSSSSSGGSKSPEAAASSAASQKLEIGRFATATSSPYLMPVYPSTTNTAVFTKPTFNPSSNSNLTWPSDPFKPTKASLTTVRTDRPRLIAPSYKWDALPNLIKTDPYLKGWNDTIFGNATDYYNASPVKYNMDGDSGILDNAREIKQRIKAFAYVYRLTKDTRWVDRAWAELQNAAGKGTSSFGSDPDRWNSGHFLDTAELTAAFAIAYDWMYDIWTDAQKSSIRATMIQYGLTFGLTEIRNGTAWWTKNITGNWNCVCNSGLTLGALAILGDDTSGIAEDILNLTVDNAKQNCVFGPSDDGTWSETANYWYFGTTGHAEMSSALLTATGSDWEMFSTNSNYYLTGLFHMYVYGTTSLFDFGDHGPNKFSTTANSMLLYGDHYSQPSYVLFQREQHDAPEPWSMFWYNPSVSGAFWDGQPLDHFFDNGLDQWASMRSSWTDNGGLYAAIKAGKNQGHQTHNDLDAGDFVLDALGTRWAGELGSGDYNSKNYFLSDAQDADRWTYYRKMTEGQNTILVNKKNQNVLAAPTITKSESSGTTQGSSTVFDVPSDSTAYWVADLTSAYFDATSVKRGMRLLNKRRQVLLQDEINAQQGVQWRMHTNATVTTNGASATLKIDDKTMSVTILNPPSGATFSTSDAVRFSTDPAPAQADQANPGVTVLIIDLPAGQYNLQVLFNPQWSGMSSSDFVTPPSVALDSWSLTSHN